MVRISLYLVVGLSLMAAACSDALVGRNCTYCNPSNGLYPRVVFVPIWRDRFRDTKLSGGVECGWRGGRKRHRRIHLLYRFLPGAGQRAFAGQHHHHGDEPVRCHQFVFRHGDDREVRHPALIRCRWLPAKPS